MLLAQVSPGILFPTRGPGIGTNCEVAQKAVACLFNADPLFTILNVFKLLSIIVALIAVIGLALPLVQKKQTTKLAKQCFIALATAVVVYGIAFMLIQSGNNAAFGGEDMGQAKQGPWPDFRLRLFE